jgi:hypothetical protein
MCVVSNTVSPSHLSVWKKVLMKEGLSLCTASPVYHKQFCALITI